MIPAKRNSISHITNIRITSPRREGKKRSRFPERREAVAIRLVEPSLISEHRSDIPEILYHREKGLSIGIYKKRKLWYNKEKT